jgi:ABC-type dipeptide/oligopeptide/nickel transport system permease component
MKFSAHLLPATRAVLSRTLPVLLGVSLIVFLIVHAIPGDPAVIAAGLEASPETVEKIRRDLGLDRPLPEQFATFLSRTARGEFGTSIRTGSPVAEEIAARLPFTIGLAAWGVALATVLGVAGGALAAVVRARRADRRGRTLDHAVMSVTLLAVSTPSYWLALMLMLVFSAWLGLLPSIGVGTPRHFVLPVVTLGLQSAGLVARMTRGALLDVLGDEYLRAARARGVPERRVIVRHAVANALLPISAIVGLRFGGLLAGTVLVESVFAIPGVGRMMVDAVLARDFPMIQGGVLVVATLYVLVNAATDALAPFIDPRLRR